MEDIQSISRSSRVRRSCGSFQFRIEGFSGLSTRVGDSTESPEFDLCGHTWQLRIFPGGSLEQHKGFLSFYLASKSTKNARASYKLCIASQIVLGTDEIFASSGVRLFEAKGVQVDGWGRDKFMAISTLMNPEFGFWIDDTVVFKVDITVFGELETIEPAITSCLSASIPSLSKCLGDMLNNKFAADLIIICPDAREFYSSGSSYENSRLSSIKSSCSSHSSGVIDTSACEEFKDSPSLYSNTSYSRMSVHRCVLMARSPVFKAMLTADMEEARSGVVNIPDINSEVMTEALRFMYTDSCSDRVAFETHATQLLCVASKYQIAALQYACEDFLSHQISIDSVISLISLADAYNGAKLKEACLQYIAQHASAIVQSKEFFQMEPDLMQETKALIDAVTRRKQGCRGLLDSAAAVGVGSGGGSGGHSGGGSDRGRFASSCAVM